MSMSEAERFANDLKNQPDVRDGVKQHAGSMADVVAFAGSRGYSFTVEEAKQYPAITGGVALDHAQLDVVAGGALNAYDKGQADKQMGWTAPTASMCQNAGCQNLQQRSRPR